jgi:8-oxo-dGTP pyrophosphatase MutT (NUDIX family)
MYAAGIFRESIRASLAPASEAPDTGGGNPAAVLVPVVDAEEPRLVFTKRTDELPRHPGEISFPGGLRQEDDADLLATALRETEEELGLSPHLVDVLGSLQPLETFTSGMTIAPFVGALDADLVFTANPGEIAEVLEVTVSDLMEIEEPRSWSRGGSTWWGYVYEVDGNTIWGATGRILHEFLEVVRGRIAHKETR